MTEGAGLRQSHFGSGYDAGKARLQAEVEQLKSLLALNLEASDGYLAELYQAKRQLAEVSKHDVCTDRLITTLRERDEARAQLAAQTAVVRLVRQACKDWHLGGVQFFNHRTVDGFEEALARLDAADVPAASTGEEA